VSDVRQPAEAAPAFAPERVRTTSAASQIADQIRAGIAAGTLSPGNRLPSELDLAEQFGVSRATVREAIKLLAAAGLVESTRGAAGGTFVVLPDPEAVATSIGEMISLWFNAGDISLLEVDEARAWVERGCVRLAALNRTEEDLEIMRACVEEARDERLTTDEWLALDLEFHVTIGRAARSRVLGLTMTAIHLVRPRTNTLLISVLEREPVMEQHTAIYEAIRDQDAERAELAFIAHFEHLSRVQEDALRTTSAEEVRIGALTPEAHPDRATTLAVRLPARRANV
jgi:GntR family transcriptional repressor for pyruvate dehydrogenase complex